MTRPPLSSVELDAILMYQHTGVGPTVDGAERMADEIRRCWAILAAVNAGLAAQQAHRDTTRSLVNFWAEGEQ